MPEIRSLVAFGLLGLLVAVFFFDVLLGDRVLLTEDPMAYEPWHAYSAEQDTAQEAGRVDCLRTYLPRTVELSRSIHSGRFPLWNPYVFAGTPFFADPQTRVVYPVSVLLGLVDPLKSMGYDVALHTLIALIGMYLFMRSMRVNRYGSMVGALAFGFSSFFFTRHGHPTFVATASWIPLLFYAFERSRRQPVGGTLLLTACLAMGYLAGHPQVFLFGVGALVIYAILMCIEDTASMGFIRALIGAKPLVIAGLLSILLVAVQLVPFIEFLNNSVGLGTDPKPIMGPYQSHPLFLTRLLYPNLYGNPVECTSWLPLIEIGGYRYSPALLYCGVGSVLLAIGASVFIRTSRHVRAMLVLLALSLGIGTSTLLFNAGTRVLPLLGYTSIGRITVVTCFALAALAGMGFSVMSSAGHERLKKYALYAIACVVGVMLVVLLIVVFRGETILSDLTRSMERSGESMGWIAAAPTEWLAYETKQVALGLSFGLLSLVLIAALTLKRPAGLWIRHLVSAIFVLMLAVDLGIAARSYYLSQPGGKLFETKGIRTLKSALGPPGEWRTLSYGRRKRIFTPNTNQIFQIYSVQGRGTIVPDTFPYLLRQSRREDSPGRKQLHSYRRSVNTIANLMSARFLLIPYLEPAWLPSPVFRAIASEEHLRPKLKISQIEGKRRLVFTQSTGESLSLDIYVPPATSLELAVGLEVGARASCDSVVILIRCECASGSRELVKYFDTDRDTGRWHPLSLDMSWAASGPGRVTLATGSRRTQGAGDVTVGWSDLEFVTDRCPQTEIPRGYEVDLRDSDHPISVEIGSNARDVPLEITSGDSPPVTRWIGFLPGTISRRVTLDVVSAGAERLEITSDSTFSLTDLRSVHPAPRWSSGYDLFYDEDMLILENFTAHKMGICISKKGASMTELDGRPLLRVCRIDSLNQFTNGECRVVSYEPERVEFKTSAVRDGYLVLQDTYYPGWRARVDGVSSEIIRTDMGLRAVELSQGDHTVVMEFKPGSLRIGLLLSLLGAALATVWAVRSRRNRC